MSSRPLALAPRITALVGMVLIFLSVAAGFDATVTSILQVAGGLLGLGGVIWFLVTLRRRG
jgi:hypothetical protein